MALTFSEVTTMRVGGPIGELRQARSTAELLDQVRDADAAGIPLLLLGGGSNLVVGDAGWPGRTIRICSGDFSIDGDLVVADAGVDWDLLVRASLADGLAGLESLSGIPGLVGATPVQNVGAFGTETAQVLESVSVYDRQTGSVEQWPVERCGFGSHRSSVFKYTDRYVVLRVVYRLRRSSQSGPIRYSEIADRLGVEVGGTASAADVRQAVLAARQARGSLLDEADHDTWTVGSFFLNPVVGEVPAEAAAAPAFQDPKGIKLAAGWLIQRAGFPPGYGAEFGAGRVRLSSKHALAISNRGGASTSEVVRFASHIRDGVRLRFGVELRPECRLVNCSLDEQVSQV
ncbi:MAG: UDP-N-acetylmuramate dehydrogenase [Jatrophihabitantaceae bacterium]